MDRDNITPSINYKDAIATTVREKLPYLVTGLVVLMMIFLLTVILYVRNDIPFKALLPQAPKQTAELKTSPTTKTYSVRPGDSLWDIAQREYNNGDMWEVLAKANNIAAPYYVYNNEKLRVPAVQPSAAEKGQISAIQSGKVTQPNATYVIKSGDTLWTIAEASYGDGNLWTRIAEANNLSDASVIHADNTLIIPR